MKINVVLLTKEQIPNGYSQNIEVLDFLEHENSLRTIERNYIPKGNFLVSTSLTSMPIMKAMNYEYYPMVMRYDSKIDVCFNPRMIYGNCENGTDYQSAHIDFVMIDAEKFSNTSLLTFTKGAPVVLFYAKDTNMLCFGTILKPALLKYGKDVFTHIIKSLGNDIIVNIPLCTQYEYEDELKIPPVITKIAEHCTGFPTRGKLGRLDKYIETTINQIIAGLNATEHDHYNCTVVLGEDTNNDCYFNHTDKFNNPVIVNITKKDNPHNISIGYDLDC